MVLLLAACQFPIPKASAPSQPHDSGLEDDDDTDPPLSTVRENCYNGADDDADGLVDCEDGDCANKNTCGEQACADTVDDDDDGLVDCQDSDCFGQPDCADTTLAMVNSGDANLYKFSTFDPYWIGSNRLILRRDQTVSARNVKGSFLQLGDGSVTRCAFHVGEAEAQLEIFGRHAPDDTGYGYDLDVATMSYESTLDRDDVVIEPGCGVDEHDLPQMLGVQSRGHQELVGHVPIIEDHGEGPEPLYDRQIWYAGRQIGDYGYRYSYYWQWTSNNVALKPQPPLVLER